jgi:hypothetical protein
VSRAVAVGSVLESRGSVAYYLGALAGLIDDSRAARGYFRQAVRAHGEWGMPVMLTRSQSRLAALG